MLLPHRGLVWLRASLLVLALAATSACSFIVSTTGLFGGPPEPGSEGGTEGSTDADASDGSVPTDAGADVISDAGFCASLSPPPVYCADFDDDRPLAAIALPGGTTMPSIDRTQGLSGTGSLYVALDATSATGKLSSSMQKSFASVPFTTYSVAFAVRMNDATAAAYTELTQFRFDDGQERIGFLVATSNQNILLYEGHGPNGIETGATLATIPHAFSAAGTEWVNIRFSGSLAGAAPTVSFFIDGFEVATAPLAFVPPSAVTAVDALYGVYYSGSNQPAKTLNVDNVVVDFKP
ncbi:MAG: hypothetical protein JWP87_1749 [Labilithrix sp.]|nr:hypothetical protein [Labilithrix sp.]